MNREQNENGVVRIIFYRVRANWRYIGKLGNSRVGAVGHNAPALRKSRDVGDPEALDGKKGAEGHVAWP